MTATTRKRALACAALLASTAAACTSDVSGDGTGPNLGRSSLIATSNRGSRAQALAVDADAVYWIDSNGLFRCAKAGCNLQPTTLAPSSTNGLQPSTSPFAGASSLVVGGTNLYWTTADQGNRPIYTCPTVGCPNGPKLLVSVPTAGGSSSGLQADASGVYFLAGLGGVPFTISSCPPSGCTQPAVVVEPSGTNGAPRFAVASGRIYFWSVNNGGSSTLPNGLLSCPTSGCGSDVRVHYAAATAGPGPATFIQGNVLAADATAVYLTSTNGPATALMRCDLPTCDGDLQTLVTSTQTAAFTSQSNVGARIFLTDDALYAASTQCSGPCNAPTLVVCAKKGCPDGASSFQPDATFPVSPNNNNNGGNGGESALALDASGIYWIAVPSYFEDGSFLLRSPLK
jgi:hypothetical protein